MNASPIYLSTYDHQRLRELLATADDRALWSDLHAELERAVVVPTHVRVPTYVVTVGTHVTFQDQHTGEITDVVLTIPGYNVFASGSEVSVLEPLGTALLGCMQGDVISFRVGDVVRELKIVHVMQSPVAEAAAALAGS